LNAELSIGSTRVVGLYQRKQPFTQLVCRTR
jgi:hypothetical protein